MNSVVLSGRLATQPELAYTPQTQTACCRFSLAVDRPKKNGQDQGADFVRITVWGKQGENCNQYLAKGQEAIISGSIRTNKGNDGKTYTEVVANNVEFGRKPTNYQTAPTTVDMPQPVQQTINVVPFNQVDDAPPF